MGGPRAAGFAGCNVAYVVKDSLHGVNLFSPVFALLHVPLCEDGPQAFFELRDFYYSLGFSKSSDDLSAWLRRKRNKAKYSKLLEELDLHETSRLRPSQKMALARDPNISSEKLAVEHRVEVMASPHFVVAFFLIMALVVSNPSFGDKAWFKGFAQRI